MGGELVRLRGHDGVELVGELLLPTQKSGPRVAVALSHAMMVDRRTLNVPRGRGLLSALVEAGAAVLWFDQRGHGQSHPHPAEGATWTYDDLVRDTAAVAGFLAERFPELPRVAVGHSLFGHVALAYQTGVLSDGPRFDGLVLLSGNVWLDEIERSRLLRVLKRLAFAPLTVLSRPLGFLPVRRARFGTADEPHPYLAQMEGWVYQGDWTSRDGRSFLKALPGVEVPILAAAGAGDKLMSTPSAALAFASLTRGPVRFLLVGKHLGYDADPDHMGLVVDANGKLGPFFREVADWVVGVGASRRDDRR